MKSQLVWIVLAISTLSLGCPSDPDPRPKLDVFQAETYGTFEYTREPDIDVTPSELDFGDMERGQVTSMPVEIHNTGTEPLDITALEITPGFEVDLLEDRLPTLAPNTSVQAIVTYRAFDTELRRGQLTILSNDPDEPVVVVELVVNNRMPCLSVAPSPLDFGVTDAGGFVVKEAVVANCSTRSRTTFSMGPLQATQGPLAFAEMNRQVYRDVRLEVGESIVIPFSFTPPTPGRFEARTVFTSDDLTKPETELILSGRGRDLDAPQPVIQATSLERGTVAIADPVGEYRGLPLDNIDLSALLSRDPEGQELTFTWALVGRPMDSAAMLSQNEGPLSKLWLDLAGTYVVELIAEAPDGRVSEPARMTLFATADQDIHIQLVWDTPNDPFQLDSSGSDVDIHLLHPSGTWNKAPWDCFWQNMEPDWGLPRGTDASGQPIGFDDDPSLDIDDVDGWGPENINYDNPEVGKTFEVGVHYFGDHGYGTSYATVRLYIGGALVFEQRRQRLREQEFWRVARISWPGAQIQAINTVSSIIP